MVFFGSKGKIVAGEVLEGFTCPGCGNSRFATFGILNYFHIYWIPTFLKSKQAGMECLHCKQTLIDDEVPSHLVGQIKSGVFTLGRTLPMFSGLIIIGLLGMAGVYFDQQSQAREATYLAAPAVNDYYVVDFTKIFEDTDADYKYGLMRISNVTATDIEMRISAIAYDRASGARKDISDGKAAADDYYSNETVYFAHSELLELKEIGAIQSIKR